MGNERTKKPGSFKSITWIASEIGNPNSTIFLIKSNITPTERETTVKAETANNKGGMSWPNNHLSIIGIPLDKFCVYLIIFLYILLIKINLNDNHEKVNLLFKQIINNLV